MNKLELGAKLSDLLSGWWEGNLPFEGVSHVSQRIIKADLVDITKDFVVYPLLRIRDVNEYLRRKAPEKTYEIPRRLIHIQRSEFVSSYYHYVIEDIYLDPHSGEEVIYHKRWFKNSSGSILVKETFLGRYSSEILKIRGDVVFHQGFQLEIDCENQDPVERNQWDNMYKNFEVEIIDNKVSREDLNFIDILEPKTHECHYLYWKYPSILHEKGEEIKQIVLSLFEKYKLFEYTSKDKLNKLKGIYWGSRRKGSKWECWIKLDCPELPEIVYEFDDNSFEEVSSGAFRTIMCIKELNESLEDYIKLSKSRKLYKETNCSVLGKKAILRIYYIHDEEDLDEEFIPPFKISRCTVAVESPRLEKLCRQYMEIDYSPDDPAWYERENTIAYEGKLIKLHLYMDEKGFSVKATFEHEELGTSTYHICGMRFGQMSPYVAERDLFKVRKELKLFSRILRYKKVLTIVKPILDDITEEEARTVAIDPEEFRKMVGFCKSPYEKALKIAFGKYPEKLTLKDIKEGAEVLKEKKPHYHCFALGAIVEMESYIKLRRVNKSVEKW